ncbi:hypothetical protein RUM44_008606 [Polyplax serrata]|uniref:Mediator of RNA polymerase II transcription subunit 13 n=1 Tax=Polyplax serrata TaxID=468196 RepID=A0ABR1B8Q3_POLSC
MGSGSSCMGNIKNEQKPPRRIPFHRRPDDGLEDSVVRSAAPGSSTPGGQPSYLRGQSMTPNAVPSIHSTSLNDSLPVPSVGSPASAAPSPLPNPHSQPASIPPADPTMPTLSPHPPASNSQPNQPSTPMEAHDKSTPAATPEVPNPKSVSSATQAFSPYPNCNSVDHKTLPTNENVSLQPVNNPQPCPTNSFPLLKRPILAWKEYETLVVEDEHQPSEFLYDYSTMDAWFNYPVKKFKPDAKESRKKYQHGDLYSTHQPNRAPTPPPEAVKIQIKQEPDATTAEAGDSCQSVVPVPGAKRSDPYEFDDDMAGANDEDRKFGDGANGTSKCTSGNLFTSEGLTASYRDLDQIFDNSDDTSSDEPVQVPTPPNSNKPAGFMEDNSQTILVKPPRGSGGATHAGILRPEELCKMFPTPPSMEHNPIASPSGHLSDGQLNEMVDGPIITRFKQEIYPNMGSPQEEPIEDWSYVFRPQLMFKMVGSSKYAPLTNLPSQNMPPVTLPSNCVYKPSWLQPPEKPTSTPPQTTVTTVTTTMTTTTTTTATTNNTPSRPGSVAHQHGPRAGLSPISPAGGHFPPSPMMTNMFRGPGSVGGGVRTPCPPPPLYEMPSPATSTASSYMNKNINSVEPAPTPVIARAPEANSLVVNILLSDTGFNIFRDHNFDSCTLCVCNAGPKCVGNIRGADAAFYIQTQQAHSAPPQNSTFPALGMNGPPPPYGMMTNPGSPGHNSHGHHEEESIHCNCGFSAVVNRRLSHKSGLFYEDELEITALAEDPNERRKNSLFSYLASMNKENINVDAAVSESLEIIPQNILELLREQFVIIQSSSNSLHRAARLYRNYTNVIPYPTTVNVLEFTDCNDVTVLALEQGRLAMETSSAICKTEDPHSRHSKIPCLPSVHRWPFLRARGPQCNQDIVRVMKNLQPILQEAIQKKCTTRLWEAPYTVSGPLTWRQFHRLAGRGTDDRCEPQPIPSLLVGYEKDWLSLSPYALHFWDKLLLEPYSYSRDVAYIVVTPENDFVLQKVRTFFKELSSTYEVCRLGRHTPITKVLRDGILRVGKAAATKLSKEPVDEWFTNLGDNSICNLLKLYAQACKYHLAPHLSQVTLDKTLLDPPEGTTKTEKTAPPPATTDSSSTTVPERAPSTPISDIENENPTTGSACPGPMDYSHDEDDSDPPTVVIYLVEPFTLGSDNVDLQRLSLLALLRCFTAVLSSVPENIRSNINVQIISLESIVELGKARETIRRNDHMRSLALSVFSQCRRLLVHTSNVKSLTGFGSAALADFFLKNKDEKNRAPYRLYSPPYILAPHKERVESNESFGKSNPQHCSVLYVSYCLSEDQRMLLTVATDDTGSIFESQTINIEIPNRSRRKKASARRIGLQKLMDFILGIISQSVQPWRLVVGRIGRIGHGELKGWSWLLSRKALLKASKHLREICNQCSLLSPTDVPCILSACLVSLEPDSALRLMPDQFTPDERFSQTSVNCQLSTPQDVTCTHILVFPTSATSQSSQTAFNEQHINGPDLGDDDIFSALNEDDVEDINGIQDLNDIFSTWPDACPGGVQSPTGSPRRNDSMSQQGSPSCNIEGNMDQQGSFPCNVPSRNGGAGDTQEEVGTLLQQPLALGYFVSTAPTGPMPSWFWASCPHLENVCPAFLKNALHMHSPSIQQSSDELLQQQSAVTDHPLDSQFTTDVLRYVLEGYNALSWLALDSNTHDRLSCLPVHVQVLMQLYHMTATLV